MDTLNLPKTADTVTYACAGCGKYVRVHHNSSWPTSCPKCGLMPFAGVVLASGAIVTHA